MKIGQRLFTKDGRKFGNAIIIETRFDAKHGLQARIETDFGNGGSWLSQSEIEEFWHTHIYGEELVEDVDDWRNDRASARLKGAIDSVQNEPDLGEWLGPAAVKVLESASQKNATEGATDVFGWIPVSEQRPPLTEETPETNGFFLLLRHNPHRDAAGQCRIYLWFGSVPIDSTHWARIPPLPNS